MAVLIFIVRPYLSRCPGQCRALLKDHCPLSSLVATEMFSIHLSIWQFSYTANFPNVNNRLDLKTARSARPVLHPLYLHIAGYNTQASMYWLGWSCSKVRETEWIDPKEASQTKSHKWLYCWQWKPPLGVSFGRFLQSEWDSPRIAPGLLLH